MSQNSPSSQPSLEKLVRTAGSLLETAYDGINTLERNVLAFLDKQTINRLLSQYDKFIKNGFNHQEALDGVINLVRGRLETATGKRG
ncbi:hypothetical protein HY405_01120 [Candidatus Microgenomates bacterium]|nr:hypothetical protein [Candidatus Microgenomates bacterium]